MLVGRWRQLVLWTCDNWQVAVVRLDCIGYSDENDHVLPTLPYSLMRFLRLDKSHIFFNRVRVSAPEVSTLPQYIYTRQKRHIVFATGYISASSHLQLSISAKPIHMPSLLCLPNIFVGLRACIILCCTHFTFCVIIILALHKVYAETQNKVQFAWNYFVSEMVRSAHWVRRFAYADRKLYTNSS